MSKNKANIPDAKRKNSFYRVLHRMFAPAFRFVNRIKVNGAENIPTNGGCLVCANHISNMDAAVLCSVFPDSRPLAFLAKAELYRVPIVNWFIHKFGAIPIKRGSGDAGAIKASVQAIADDRPLLVFPQGHRQMNKNPAETEIKHGAGLILSRAKCPVIPVSISMKNMRFAPFRKICVNIGTPIPYEDFDFTLTNIEAYKRATEQIFGAVCSLGGFAMISEVSNEDNRG